MFTLINKLVLNKMSFLSPMIILLTLVTLLNYLIKQ